MPNSPPLSFSSTKLCKPSHRRTQSSITPQASRDSSAQQIWAEDYYADDSSSPFGQITPPPPATLTSRPYPRSIPLTSEEEPHPAPQSRTHQRSLTELIPFQSSRLNETSARRSPIKEISTKEFEDGFIPTLTGDQDCTIRVSDKSRKGLGGWFSGASAPVQLGVPVVEQERTVPTPSGNASPERKPTKLQKRPTLPNMDTTSGTIGRASGQSSSIFGGFFSSPRTPETPTNKIPTSLNLEADEFLTLDIEKSLFPNGSASPSSPSAFNNLLMNAEGLLLRLQTAYKLRTMSLNELIAEREARDEEFEEAEIRATSLKSQLKDMAHRVSKHEETIKALTDELAFEKQSRAEERLARERSITLLKSQRSSYTSSTASSPFDDLGISLATGTSTPRKVEHRWRESYGSTDVSEAEDGVFSRSDSPAPTLDSVSVGYGPTQNYPSSPYAQSNSSMTEIGQATVGRIVIIPSRQQRPKLVHQQQSQTYNQNAFQKVLKSFSPVASERGSILSGNTYAESVCGNCQGRGDVSGAWDTVGLLKVENKVLKERVGKLEEGLEDALDAVNGIGMLR